MIEALALAAALSVAPMDVSIAELRGAPQRYDQKVVRLRGTLKAHPFNTFSSLCPEENTDDSPCLGVAFDDYGLSSPDALGAKAVAAAFRWATVTVTARFDAFCLRANSICLDYPTYLWDARVQAVHHRQSSAEVQGPGALRLTPAEVADAAAMLDAYRHVSGRQVDAQPETAAFIAPELTDRGAVCAWRWGHRDGPWPSSLIAVNAPSAIDHFTCWSTQKVAGQWRIIVK